jgi:hypothetical protein
MKKALFVVIFIVIALIITTISCDTGTGPGFGPGPGTGTGDLKYSVQVNNQLSPARSLMAGDTVELYIENFEYCEDAENRALILIANGDRSMGSKGGILNNAGWYSVHSELAVENDVNNGPYSSFQIKISKLKVNGTEYDFPGGNKWFGNPTTIWNGGQAGEYPNNFSGITMTDDVVSLKTILTVEPDILDGTGNLASDPYQYIKVEGKINE